MSFQSFFMGGFECSTHRNLSRTRLDMVSSTKHDCYVLKDYQRLNSIGIKTVREGIRWHLIERRQDLYNFSSVLKIIKAANKTQTQVLWDLIHYGWPDHIDIFKPDFIRRFKRFTKAFINFLVNETDQLPFITPINEISYVSWACGEVGYMYPYCYTKSYELKMQLVRATIEAIEVIWLKRPDSRILNIDPSVYVIPANDTNDDRLLARQFNELQYQARDMLIGRTEPQLGGDEKYLDIIGINYYPFNQWIHNVILNSDDVIESENYNFFKPFNLILEEVYTRYNRPIFISETGTEGNQRVNWLIYLYNEVLLAIERDIPIQGVCWYPILNTLHWDTNRYCPNGLWDFSNDKGEREIYEPLAREFKRLINDKLVQA